MFSTELCIFVFVRAAGSNFQMASSPISFFQWLHLETVICYIALCIYALDAMLLTLALIGGPSHSVNDFLNRYFLEMSSIYIIL